MAKGSHIPVGLDTPEILPRGHDYELALTDEWAHETGVLSVRSRRGSFRMSTLLTSWQDNNRDEVDGRKRQGVTADFIGLQISREALMVLFGEFTFESITILL